MDEQQQQKALGAEQELSREEITLMLTASPARGVEVLRQEYVQRSISHLIVADQQWSATYGIDLLESLSKAIRTHVYETYNWELRATLLQAWARIPALYESQLIHSWLDIQWNELATLLSLELPEEWHKTAIIMLLNTPMDIPPQYIVSIVSYHNDLFTATLHQLMRTPQTQKTATGFFATLAKHGYAHKVQLLEVLLGAGTLSLNLMETLLTAAHLETRSIVNLLENHCQLILAKHELSATMLSFIREYFINFDVDYLNSERTKELLQRLHQRNTQPALRLPAELQAHVQWWSAIAELIEQPTTGRQWLRKISSRVHMLPQLIPDIQIKLTALLIPLLIEFVTTEVDLGRIMDNLGHVLMGGNIGKVGPDLLLLEQMTTKASTVFRRERPPLRILPYIKVVLAEAHYLPSPEKEEFIHRCLYVWLRSLDPDTLNTLKSHMTLWPLECQAEWKALLARSGLASVTTTVAGTEQPRLTLQQFPQQTVSLSAESRGNVYRPVAIVNEQPISFEHFRKMCCIKPIYMQYEVHAQQHIARESKPSKTKEVHGQKNAQQMQKEALDDLIDDLLIQEEVAELIKHNGLLSLNFDSNRQLSPLLQSFKEFCGVRYTTLLSTYQLNDADVASVLRIFIRRELFEQYLVNQRKVLSNWLKERRRRAKIVMNI